MDVDIGANPSAEGGDEEGVESTSRKVVDLIDAFRLQVRHRYGRHQDTAGMSMGSTISTPQGYVEGLVWTFTPTIWDAASCFDELQT